MAAGRGPRVLIATLFLPETINFDEEQLSLPALSLPTHHEHEHSGDSHISTVPGAKPADHANDIAGLAGQDADANANTDLPVIHSGRASPVMQEPASYSMSRDTSDTGGADNLKGSTGTNGSRLSVPTINELRQSSGSSSSRSSRPGVTRAASIVDDLKARGTGSAGTVSPKLTPNELDLGTNPFEVAAAAALPAKLNPSAAPSVLRRPQVTRLISEGAGTSPGLGLSAAVRQRLEMSASERRPSTRSLIQPNTPLALTKMARDVDGVESYFSDTAAPGNAAANARTRRRSSGASSKTAFPASSQNLSRAFSRTRSREYHRRRSSSTVDASSAYANGTAQIPPFHFESNPHGNGGLQNAVRSVADTHARSSSEPNAPGHAAAPGIRGNIPGVKSPIGEYIWIGTPGCSIGDFDEDLRKVMQKRYMSEKKSAVVWVEDEVLEPAYDMFCKQILWPTFHYQVYDAHKSKAYESPAWSDYKAMNKAFADRIVATYQDGDMIWINDYHLLLVPQMVREQLPHATIGFFLHIAFPSSEIFRCLANRKDILEGVLGADLIGFQTYNTARHFRQTCSRLLSVEATPKGIQLDSGFARVGVFPIGIDVKALHERKKEPEVTEWVKILRERYTGYKVLIARDKLDEIKGVRQKLVAFEAFLERYPEWQGKVVLIQVAMATAEENEKQGDVMDLVARINARFSSLTYTPVVFLHQDVSFSQYLALLQMADCFINSSLREGMNLTSHEYVICQEGQWGPLILSEFTGSYSRAGFQRCIPINPYDKLQCARAIYEALTMPEAEKISRWRDLERHVWTQTAQHWCTTYLTWLGREVHNAKGRPALTPMSEKGLDLPPAFDLPNALEGYRSSNRRLLLFDLEGTLCEEVLRVKHFAKGQDAKSVPLKLQEGVEAAVTKLADDPKNRVYLMSGHSLEDLADFAAKYPKLGFIAENGCYVTLCVTQAGAVTKQRKWHKLVTGTHQSWRQPVLEILRYYTERTPGSYIDDRGISIVWRYANTEGHFNPNARSQPQNGEAGHLLDEPPMFKNGKGNDAYLWARRQAAEVQNHIMDALGERFGLQLHPGATSFLILPRKAGRAIAVAHILQADDFGEAALDTENTKGNQAAVDAEAGGEEADEEKIEAQNEDAALAADAADRRTAGSSDQLSKRNGQNEVNRVVASKHLLEQYDYVLALGEDQRLCAWLEEMALEKIVTVAVGEKRRGARYRLPGPQQVANVLQGLAEVRT